MDLIRENFNAAVGINTGILADAMLGCWLSPVASTLLHNDTAIAILFRALRDVSLSKEEDKPGQLKSPPILSHLNDLALPTGL